MTDSDKSKHIRHGGPVTLADIANTPASRRSPFRAPSTLRAGQAHTLEAIEKVIARTGYVPKPACRRPGFTPH